MGLGSFLKEASERLLGKAAREASEEAAIRAGEAAERAAREAAERAARMTPEEITERLARAQAKGAAERTAQAAGRAAGETAEQAAPDAARAGFRAAGDDAAEAAASVGGKMSFRQAKIYLLNKDLPMATKISGLINGGHEDMINLAFAQIRKDGKFVADFPSFKMQAATNKIPAELVEKAEILATRLGRLTPFGQKMEKISANLDYYKELASFTAKNPLGSAWHQFSTRPLQTITSPIKLLWGAHVKPATFVLKHPVAAALSTPVAVATGVVGHQTTDGFTTEATVAVAKFAGNALWEADKLVVGSAYTLGKGALSLIPGVDAKEAIDAVKEEGLDVAKGTPDYLLSLAAYAASTTPEAIKEDPLKFQQDHPVISYLVLPQPLKAAFSAAGVARSINEIAPATGAETSPAGDRVAALRDTAENVVGKVKNDAGIMADTAQNTAEGALDSVSLANALRNPEQAWNSLRQFAATNPTMQRAMEIGEQNPFLKWGLIGGFAMGALGNGTPMERISNGLKQALFLGIMLDLLGGLFGKPSLIMGTVGNMMSGRSSTPQPTLTQGMERELGITPAAPAAATTAPATDPGADPLTTIPAATTPAAPANITPVFSAQAQQPAQPDLSSNQQAFKSAGQPATPPAPNFSDLHQRQNLVYAPSTM